MERLFTRIANYIAHATGTPLAFIICVVTVIAWAISGPMFSYSDTWQLVINTVQEPELALLLSSFSGELENYA